MLHVWHRLSIRRPVISYFCLVCICTPQLCPLQCFEYKEHLLVAIYSSGYIRHTWRNPGKKRMGYILILLSALWLQDCCSQINNTKSLSRLVFWSRWRWIEASPRSALEVPTETMEIKNCYGRQKWKERVFSLKNVGKVSQIELKSESEMWK